MTEELDQLAVTIAGRGEQEVRARLRDAFAAQALAGAGEVALTPEEVDELLDTATHRAGGALWRRALAGVASAELGIDLAEAISHPAVLRAHELVGAPAYDAPVAPPEPEVVPDEALADADEELVEAGDELVEADEELVEADEALLQAVEEIVAGAEEPPIDEPVTAPDALRIPAVHLGGIEALRAGDKDLELRFSLAGLDVLKRSSGAAIGRLEWNEIVTVDLPRGRRGLRPGRRRAQELHVATDRGRASFQLPGLTEEQLREHLEPMLERTRGAGSRAGDSR